jgi:3-dehydrosphinganine reductase
MKNFEGKTALITGGSSGIGLAVAKNLASKGAHIWIMARSPQRLEEACVEITQICQSSSQKVRTIQADVSDKEQVDRGLAPVIAEGGVDILINSAGLTYPGLFEQLDHRVFREMMEVNYFGTLYVTKALVPAMIKRGSGHILNISSLVGLHGVYGYSAYSPAKFAVRGLSDTLRYELQPQGIKVSVAFPADTQTPQLDFENQRKPAVLKALVTSNTSVSSPASVAENIIRAMQKDRYLIFPSSDSLLWYVINTLLPGHAMYWLVDVLMAQARRKVAKSLAGKQHEHHPD